MSAETSKKIFGNIILAFILGMVIVMVVGLLNNNFFPKRVPTEVILTKSPLQVTFKGNDRIDVENLVKDAKDFPFVDYKFNTSLSVKLETEDIRTSNSDTKMNINESTTNNTNFGGQKNQKNDQKSSEGQ